MEYILAVCTLLVAVGINGGFYLLLWHVINQVLDKDQPKFWFWTNLAMALVVLGITVAMSIGIIAALINVTFHA